MPYSPPVYSSNGVTTTGAGSVVDIGDVNVGDIPAVMIITISDTATVDVQGSHDGINFVTFSTLTASDALDLITGIRFWRTNVTAHTGGYVTSSVGYVPRQGGGVQPRLYSTTTNTPGLPGS